MTCLPHEARSLVWRAEGGKVRALLLSVADDMTGLGSTRTVR